MIGDAVDVTDEMVVGCVTYFRTLELMPSAPINKEVVIFVPSLNWSKTLGSPKLFVLAFSSSSAVVLADAASSIFASAEVVELLTDVTACNRFPK